MKLLLAILMVLFCNLTNGQTISQFIQMIKIDSMTKTVNQLSGEDSSTIGNKKVLIDNRSTKEGKRQTADYLLMRLKHIGLEGVVQEFDKDSRNILAYQKGSVNPNKLLIVCGHYDAVTKYCADDNASSVGAILEIARVFKNKCFENTIVYAFWDEEEIGLLGSQYFALNAKNEGYNIMGVLNAEMLGYDGNDDGKFEIHVNDNAESLVLKDLVLSVVEQYKIDLSPQIFQPGNPGSDHSSFWKNGFPGLAISEAFFSNDGNPKYHSQKDRIDLFNLDYYTNMAKMLLGATAELAGSCKSNVDQIENVITVMYPNPATNSLNVQITHTNTQYQELTITNMLGAIFISIPITGKEVEVIDISELPTGLYFLSMGGNGVQFIKN